MPPCEAAGCACRSLLSATEGRTKRRDGSACTARRTARAACSARLRTWFLAVLEACSEMPVEAASLMMATLRLPAMKRSFSTTASGQAAGARGEARTPPWHLWPPPHRRRKCPATKRSLPHTSGLLLPCCTRRNECLHTVKASVQARARGCKGGRANASKQRRAGHCSPLSESISAESGTARSSYTYSNAPLGRTRRTMRPLRPVISATCRRSSHRMTHAHSVALS